MINGQDNALLGAFFDTILQLLQRGQHRHGFDGWRRRLLGRISGPVRENLSRRARSKPPDTVMAVTTVTTTSPPLKPGAST